MDKLVRTIYYLAVSQKDWKQTNSRIWLPKIDLDRGLDFPIYTGIWTDLVVTVVLKKLQTKNVKNWLVPVNNTE